MEDKELLAAQKRLEEKQASLKQAQVIPTGSGKIVKGEALGDCVDCGKPALATDADVFFLNLDIGTPRQLSKNLRCEECTEIENAKLDSERQEREKESGERQRRQRAEERKKESGIGLKFLSMAWADYETVNQDAAIIKSVCQEYADTFHRESCDLVMIGACGTGKNMLASLIGMQIMDNDFTFSYTTAMRLVREVKDSWRDKSTSEQSVIDSFTRPALLCIDEIGVQFGSPTEQLFITEVINNRYEMNKPTILISNLKMSQVEEVLGARVIDRFHERGKFLVFKWDSYRRRK